MKARIKKTGEIINLASYATIALDAHDSWGNPIEVKPEEVELVYETPSEHDTLSTELKTFAQVVEEKHWQDIRERAAITAMQGLLANSRRTGPFREYAEIAIDYADELVEQLKVKSQLCLKMTMTQE